MFGMKIRLTTLLSSNMIPATIWIGGNFLRYDAPMVTPTNLTCSASVLLSLYIGLFRLAQFQPIWRRIYVFVLSCYPSWHSHDHAVHTHSSLLLQEPYVVDILTGKLSRFSAHTSLTELSGV